MKQFEITVEQKEQIVRRSREAQAFLRSFLFEETKKWVEQEKKLAIESIVSNVRNDEDKTLSRLEYVEKMSAYYKALGTVLAVYESFARQEDQVKDIPVKNEEH